MKLIEQGFLKRNWKLILVSLAIFLIFAVGSAAVASIFAGDHLNEVSNTFDEARINNITLNENESVSINSAELFIHNLGVDLIIVAGGIFLSIPSLILTIFNAVDIAAVFGLDFKFASASILPHAIFEYLATVLGLTIAFLITKLEIRIIKAKNIKNTLIENQTILKDILVLFLVMVVLLIIAAIIEGHITGMIVNMVYGT